MERMDFNMTAQPDRMEDLPDEERRPSTYWLLGSSFIVHADRGDSDGHYDLIEGRQPPGSQTPPHRHTRYSEHFYVLEGEYTIWIGDRQVVLHPGDTAFIPPGTVHMVSVTGSGPARGLVVASPSAFADLIREVGSPDTGDDPPEPTPDELDHFTHVAVELGDEILGPPGVYPTSEVT